MSSFKKLTHVIWHCQYHLVWVPKYRYRVLSGAMGRRIANCIEVYSSRLRCEVVEFNVQQGHVHLLLKVPPKISISHLMGVVKGKSAIRIFTRYPHLRKKPYSGNHFWAKGYGRVGCRDDTQVCKVSGGTGTKTTGSGYIEMKPKAHTQLACLLGRKRGWSD